MGNMNKTRRRYWLGTIVGLSLTTLVGCQTWVTEAGLTLPSPHYLEHPAHTFQRHHRSPCREN